MDAFSGWMNDGLPRVVQLLRKGMQANGDILREEGLDFTGRNDIYEILDDLLAIFFPGCYSRQSVPRGEPGPFLSNTLRNVAARLGRHIRNVFTYRAQKENSGNSNCEERAEQVLIRFVESLPAIREALLEDVQAAFEGDPAARYMDEIIMSYPCVEAIATYRTAHLLYELDVPIIPRIMSERAHSRTGIDIHPGAAIGPRFFIDHGTGVVIGETTRIGRNVKLYQGVTLGALSPFDSQGHPRKGEKRHPDIGDDVIIYANATILGGSTVIGKGAVIGGNMWITKSVPPGARIQ